MNFQAMDAFLADMMAYGIPAMEVAVTKDGKTVYHKAVGYADAAGTRPSATTDIRWLFSCTKVMTCIAAMRLVEEGRLALNAPVSRYLPEYAHLRVKDRKTGEEWEARETMTVAHLFGMMGGLDYDLSAPAIQEAVAGSGSTRDVVAAMAVKPLHFEPGASFQYSLCHDVLACVVEVVAGKSFGAYLDEIIFKPLGLTDIGFVPTAEQSARMTQMYDYNANTREIFACDGGNEYVLSPHYESGGAGLFSTVEAYSKFLAALANGESAEGYRILQPETIRQISETDILTPGGKIGMQASWSSRFFGYSWGLCGRVHLDPIASRAGSPKGEFGWDGAANSFCLIDPVNRVSVMLGMNIRHFVYGYHVLHPQLRALIYQCLEAK